MAKEPPPRQPRAEREQRLAELCELLAARAAAARLVRSACEKWGLGERAAQRYVAEARERLRTSADFDRRLECGLAFAGYKLIFRRQLKAGDLRNARATLDKLVALLGLAAPARGQPLTLETIAAEIARLEAAIVEPRGADAVRPAAPSALRRAAGSSQLACVRPAPGWSAMPSIGRELRRPSAAAGCSDLDPGRGPLLACLGQRYGDDDAREYLAAIDAFLEERAAELGVGDERE